MALIEIENINSITFTHIGGNGSSTNPWTISNIDGLLEMIEFANKYKLKPPESNPYLYMSFLNDIDCDDAPDDICVDFPTIKFIDCCHYTKIEYGETVYYGGLIVNGNNHCIKNLYTRTGNVIDIPVSKGMKIMNLKIIDFTQYLTYECRSKSVISYNNDLQSNGSFVKCVIAGYTNTVGSICEGSSLYGTNTSYGAIFDHCVINIKHRPMITTESNNALFYCTKMIKSSVKIDSIITKYSTLFSSCKIDTVILEGKLDISEHITQTDTINTLVYKKFIMTGGTSATTYRLMSYINVVNNTKNRLGVKLSADFLNEAVPSIYLKDNFDSNIRIYGITDTHRVLTSAQFSDPSYLTRIGLLCL